MSGGNRASTAGRGEYAAKFRPFSFPVCRRVGVLGPIAVDLFPPVDAPGYNRISQRSCPHRVRVCVADTLSHQSCYEVAAEQHLVCGTLEYMTTMLRCHGGSKALNVRGSLVTVPYSCLGGLRWRVRCRSRRVRGRSAGPSPPSSDNFLHTVQGRTFGAPGLTAPAVNRADGREQSRGIERPR